jgi:hypothetical protein
MNSNRYQGILTKTVLVLSLLLPAGFNVYAAAGYKLADKVGKGIAEFRDEIIKAKEAVNATMASLDKVVAEAATDPRKPFKQFDKNVPRIESAAAKAKKRADEMRERGQEYFKTWEQELASVHSAEIKKLAEERKAKLQTTFGSIKAKLDPAREQFTTWLAHLKDVQTYLRQDLTIVGIDMAKDLIATSKKDGAALQQSLDGVIAELNTILAAITPAKVEKK